MHEFLHQECDYRRTREFQIHYVGGLIYLVPRQRAARPVALALPLGDVLHETPLEVAGQDSLLVVGERARAGCYQSAYDARPQIAYLLVGVIHPLHIRYNALATLRLEECQQKLDHFTCGKQPELMGILDVHYLIADIVGRLHEIYQRMAGVAERAVIAVARKHPELVGNPAEILLFRRKETEFALLAGKHRLVRIFHYRGQCGVGHREAARTAPLEAMGQQTESIGVTFEMRQIGPLAGRQLRLQFSTGPFAEEGGNGLLT